LGGLGASIRTRGLTRLIQPTQNGARLIRIVNPVKRYTMGAIPTSDMPGYRRLHERVINALDRCQESQGIDFKESASWNSLKWRIIITSLGMGNLRDGGLIVIGASERGQTWELTGITKEHLATYDPDVLIDVVNKYSSPNIEMDIVLTKYQNDREFLSIQINEFKDTPYVCRKNGREGEGITEGAVYVRPPGVARTTRVMDSSQMHDLLELAAEKRARRILEVSHRIGLVATPSSKERFKEELEGL